MFKPVFSSLSLLKEHLLRGKWKGLSVSDGWQIVLLICKSRNAFKELKISNIESLAEESTEI